MVTFFTAYLGGTHGTAKSARDFLRALLACHDSVRVIAPNQEEFPSAICDINLSIPMWLDMPVAAKFPVAPWNFRPSKIKKWLRYKRALNRLRAENLHDTVIVNGWASYARWQLVKNLFKGPKIIIVRESPRHFIGPDRNQLPPDLVGGFSSFDHLIFVSERVCHEWRKYEEIASKQYSVLPNCCEEEEVTRYGAQDRVGIRRQLGFHSDDFVVLCPGTIEHRKGQDLLVAVAPELHARIPNLKILLLGDPATQWGRNLLKTIPRDLLGCSIVHWNARPGIMDLLYAADLLAFPSRAEALPRTILEAMVMKTAVVASDVDGIPELIEDGETGLLFCSGDKNGLLHAILRLYSDPELRSKLREAGSKRYWEYFSRRHQFDRMSEVSKNIRNSTSLV